MMKKVLFAAVLLAVLAGCKPKTPEAPKIDVTGAWELSSVSTKVSVGGEQVSVYLEFSSEGAFTLYQKIGNGRYARFNGNYAIDQEAEELSGSYSNGKAWGPYSCSCSGSSLTLSIVDGSEIDVYTKIDAVPSSVAGNVY